MGRTNIDLSTGIRYGVIPAADLGAAWWENSTPYYGVATCPKCGNEAAEYDKAEDEYGAENVQVDDETGEESPAELSALRRGCCADWGCVRCGIYFDGEDAYGDEPLAHRYGVDDNGEALPDTDIVASQGGDDCDVWVFKSDYFTFAPFCSPCAPGACYLRDGDYTGDARAYCFGHDWFWDRDGAAVAPYPVFLIADGSEVYPAGLSF